jgi:predicted DNA-binding protein
MSGTTSPRTAFIGIRVSQEELHKLQGLAGKSGRTMSQVVRLLLRRAKVLDVPDIAFAPEERAHESA